MVAMDSPPAPAGNDDKGCGIESSSNDNELSALFAEAVFDLVNVDAGSDPIAVTIGHVPEYVRAQAVAFQLGHQFPGAGVNLDRGSAGEIHKVDDGVAYGGFIRNGPGVGTGELRRHRGRQEVQAGLPNRSGNRTVGIGRRGANDDGNKLALGAVHVNPDGGWIVV